MRRYLLMAMLCIGLLAACQPSDNGIIDITSPFLGGTDAISIDLLNMRADVFDGGEDPFDIVVQLENRGEFTVPKDQVRVSVSGINPAEFSKLDLATSPDDDLLALRKDSQGSIITSPRVIVEFTDLNYLPRLVGTTQSFPLVIDVCHLYGTQARTNMCVLKDILTPKPGRVCEIQGDKQAFNSGAPVQVTNVKEFAKGKDKVGLTFDIIHQGTGNIYDAGTRCVNERFKNKVVVTVDTRLNGLTCTGLSAMTGTSVSGTVSLPEGQKTISCTQVISGNADFEQPVAIELSYDYNVQKRTQLNVKQSSPNLE